MKKAKLSSIFACALSVALAPAFLFAQTTQTTSATAPTTVGVPAGFGGILSCNQNGAYAMSVGALGATGGIYVPVADATVELNTGTLVYKECVLREVLVAQRKAATAGFLDQAQNEIQTDRNGSPLYVQNILKEKLDADTAVVQDDLENNGSFDTIDSSIKSDAARAIARDYVQRTQQQNSQLACPPGNAKTLYSGQSSDLDSIAALENPACNPYGATLLGYTQVATDVNAANNVLDQEWQAGGMFYPVTQGGSNPLTQTIVTPSSIVRDSYTQVLTSPFRQLESASDLGQMVGALFGGISTQVLSSNGGGLAGLTQPIGNQPSYLDQAVTQTTQDLQNSISNAALANLTAALQVEQQYFTIMNTIASTLDDTINKLRNGEQQCWVQVETKVCGSTPSGNTCTDASGNNYQIATSTAFSQAAINAGNIPSLASTTVNNIKISQQALNLINNLIKGVTNSSPDSQAVAVEQLNQLIVNHQLHTTPDIQTAQSQQTSVQNAMQTLTQNTLQLWAGTNPNDTTITDIPWDGTTSPGAGWCNFQNQTTIQAWTNKWKI